MPNTIRSYRGELADNAGMRGCCSPGVGIIGESAFKRLCRMRHNRFSIGIRNSNDKSIRLGLTAGLRVFVCSNMAFSGDFTPVTM